MGCIGCRPPSPCASIVFGPSAAICFREDINQSPLIQNAAALVRVVDYIHLNPVRAGIVGAGQSAEFRRGSLARFVEGPRPGWLSPAAWLGELRLADSREGWSRYLERLAGIAGDPAAQEALRFDEIARGHPIGTPAWKESLAREHRHRALEVDLPHDETSALKEARWNDALDAALSAYQKTRQDVAAIPGRPAWKVAIAARVRNLSGAPYSWIGEKLHMGPVLALRVAVWRAGRGNM